MDIKRSFKIWSVHTNAVQKLSFPQSVFKRVLSLHNNQLSEAKTFIRSRNISNQTQFNVLFGVSKI